MKMKCTQFLILIKPQVSLKILKYCVQTLNHPLCHLFNLSLASGIVQKEWEVHLDVPVFKSADHLSVKNYRLISLLGNTSKVLEALIYSKSLTMCSIISQNASLDFCQADPSPNSFFYT